MYINNTSSRGKRNKKGKYFLNFNLKIFINIYQEITIFDLGWGLNSKQLGLLSSKALEHTAVAEYVEEATEECTA